MRPERIRMWLVAEQLVAEVDRLLPLVRPAAPNAAEHLERSAESVLFNIGEGVGAWSPKTKIAAYEISKREASELRAILRRSSSSACSPRTTHVKPTTSPAPPSAC